MEVALLEAHGLSPKDIVQLRVGNTRRQGHVGQVFDFPTMPATSLPLQVEVLCPMSSASACDFNPGGLASCDVGVPAIEGVWSAPSQLSIQVREAAATCAADRALGAAGDAAPSAKRSGQEDGLRAKKREEAAEKARRYMAQHEVVGYVQQMLATMLSEQPEDPFSFMATFAQRTAEARQREAPGPAPPPQPEGVLTATAAVTVAAVAARKAAVPEAEEAVAVAETPQYVQKADGVRKATSLTTYGNDEAGAETPPLLEYSVDDEYDLLREENDMLVAANKDLESEIAGIRAVLSGGASSHSNPMDMLLGLPNCESCPPPPVECVVGLRFSLEGLDAKVLAAREALQVELRNALVAELASQAGVPESSVYVDLCSGGAGGASSSSSSSAVEAMVRSRNAEDVHSRLWLGVCRARGNELREGIQNCVCALPGMVAAAIGPVAAQHLELYGPVSFPEEPQVQPRCTSAPPACAFFAELRQSPALQSMVLTAEEPASEKRLQAAAEVAELTALPAMMAPASKEGAPLHLDLDAAFEAAVGDIYQELYYLNYSLRKQFRRKMAEFSTLKDEREQNKDMLLNLCSGDDGVEAFKESEAASQKVEELLPQLRAPMKRSSLEAENRELQEAIGAVSSVISALFQESQAFQSELRSRAKSRLT
eukprot:TRINITY_DN29530_c0_g1_i1.p1 TRINITY_DN29530_c0_g1~~TRINITY_DN29530_c0_g1_i1.p1  ORF type:complete len:655 (-),score=199.15 TRINITY_DN29530_c0_g1_i1:256-2220(-)